MYIYALHPTKNIKFREWVFLTPGLAAALRPVVSHGDELTSFDFRSHLLRLSSLCFRAELLWKRCACNIICLCTGLKCIDLCLYQDMTPFGHVRSANKPGTASSSGPSCVPSTEPLGLLFFLQLKYQQYVAVFLPLFLLKSCFFFRRLPLSASRVRQQDCL